VPWVATIAPDLAVLVGYCGCTPKLPPANPEPPAPHPPNRTAVCGAGVVPELAAREPAVDAHCRAVLVDGAGTPKVRARSQYRFCTIVHPLHTRFTKRFGTSVPDAIMRPDSRRTAAAWRRRRAPGSSAARTRACTPGGPTRRASRRSTSSA
jgi:hypothetical protein